MDTLEELSSVMSRYLRLKKATFTVGVKSLNSRKTHFSRRPMLDLNKYTSICNAVLNRALVHLDNVCFYAEIDEIIQVHVGKSEEVAEQVHKTEQLCGSSNH